MTEQQWRSSTGLTVFGFVRSRQDVGTYQSCSVQVRLRKPRVPESAV